jgi:hypothetical protein
MGARQERLGCKPETGVRERSRTIGAWEERTAQASRISDLGNLGARHAVCVGLSGSEERHMPWVIFILLLTLWGVGLVGPATGGGLLHLLLAAAAVALALALAVRRGPRAWTGAGRLRAGRPGNQARPWALAEALAAPLATLRPVSQRERLAATANQPTGTLRVGLFKPRSRGEQAALDAASVLLRRP